MTEWSGEEKEVWRFPHAKYEGSDIEAMEIQGKGNKNQKL